MTKLLAVLVVAVMALPIGRVEPNPHWKSFVLGNPPQPSEVAPDAYQKWGSVGAVETAPQGVPQ